jgi:iron complex outermembrane receptor protein
MVSDPVTLTPIINPTTGLPTPALGRTGVLTGFYGNPRQVWLSAGFNF